MAERTPRPPHTFTWLVVRDKYGDVISVTRYRSSRAAKEARERAVLKQRDHQPVVTMDVYDGATFRQAFQG